MILSSSVAPARSGWRFIVNEKDPAAAWPLEEVTIQLAFHSAGHQHARVGIGGRDRSDIKECAQHFHGRKGELLRAIELGQSEVIVRIAADRIVASPQILDLVNA